VTLIGEAGIPVWAPPLTNKTGHGCPRVPELPWWTTEEIAPPEMAKDPVTNRAPPLSIFRKCAVDPETPPTRNIDWDSVFTVLPDRISKKDPEASTRAIIWSSIVRGILSEYPQKEKGAKVN
jgi:hypothetical protein